MKKSQLRKIIRESIREMMMEQEVGGIDKNQTGGKFTQGPPQTSPQSSPPPPSPPPPCGCMDPTAYNYDANATCSDGSCIYTLMGCTDPNAFNYNSAATQDDGSCVYAGCMDPTASNYDANANMDDGSCTYAGSTGCDLTLPWNPPNSGFNQNIDTNTALNNWISTMEGKINNALANKPWMANHADSNNGGPVGNADQPCKFINGVGCVGNECNNNLLAKNTDRMVFATQSAGNDPTHPWINQISCKIEAVSSGGMLANLFGC